MTVGGYRWQRSAGDRQKQVRQFSATLGGSVTAVFSSGCGAGVWAAGRCSCGGCFAMMV
jgi:hypothetical protein